MNFRVSTLKRALLAAGIVLAAGAVGHAQAMKTGQKIFFSQSDNDIAGTNAASLAPHSPELSPVANAIKPAPLNLNFGPAPASSQLPMPRPASVTPEQVSKARQTADKQKNWALMTPAEIMGVPTAEKIMGIPERDANGQLKGDTVEERYLAREMKNNGNGRTNKPSAYSPDDENWNLTKSDVKRDFFGRPVDAPRPAFSVFGNDENASRSSEQNFGARPANASGNGSYSYNAGQSSRSQTPEQIAAAREFEKLLQPSIMMGPKSASATFSTPSPPAPANRSINMPLPPFAPASQVVTPTGVRPLLSSGAEKDTSMTPVWKPQLPPWMSTTPQPGTVPQRKF